MLTLPLLRRYVAILSVFYGSAELTSNIASGLIGFLGRTVMMRGEKEGAR